MKIVITVGHSKLKNGSYTSADGTKYGGCNEYKWCKAFSKQLAAALRKRGNIVKRVVCPEGKFIDSEQEKIYKLNIVNAEKYDLLIELHLNAATIVTASGCEVLYKSTAGKTYAEKVQAALGTIFKNRGAKKRDNLYILNQTRPTAILIETFFCTNVDDYKKAKGLSKRRKIAKLIANSIG